MGNSTRPIDQEIYETVMKMLSNGYKISEIAKQTGINRSSISNWKQRSGRIKIETKETNEIKEDKFFSNFIESLTPNKKLDYSYILGVYLGDGCIYKHKDKNYRTLTITSDKKYADLNDYTIQCFTRFFGKAPRVVDRTLYGRGNAIDIIYSHKHLDLVFPHCGRGHKHDRKIELSPWQESIIDPVQLLRGLFMSDGSFYIDSQCNKMKIGFSNKSKDIISIAEKYLDIVDVYYRTNTSKSGMYRLNITKKNDVEKMVNMMGTKTSIK